MAIKNNRSNVLDDDLFSLNKLTRAVSEQLISDSAVARRKGKAVLNSAALLVAGACLLTPDYGFAQQANPDSATEIARLKEKLLEIEKENELLKNALVAAPSPTATTSATKADSIDALKPEVAAAESKEEKAPVSESKNLSEVVVTSRRREEKLQEV